MTSRSRILIADDHKLVAELFQRLLAIEFERRSCLGACCRRIETQPNRDRYLDAYSRWP